jgi:hypothetical protein
MRHLPYVPARGHSTQAIQQYGLLINNLVPVSPQPDSFIVFGTTQPITKLLNQFKELVSLCRTLFGAGRGRYLLQEHAHSYGGYNKERSAGSRCIAPSMSFIAKYVNEFALLQYPPRPSVMEAYFS